MNSFLEKNYKNYISLGFFCSIALDLKSFGLRLFSSPFDWLISPFESVLELICNRFNGFLDYELMEQSRKVPCHYKNSKYEIEFYHDFNDVEPLSAQLPKVKEKYDRRIERFYNNIKEPTLFIRYIRNDYEAAFVENNYDKIQHLLKSFNEDSEIIYLCNESVHCHLDCVYKVKQDENDSVCRKPLLSSKELKLFFEIRGHEYTEMKQAVETYGRSANIFARIMQKVRNRLRKRYIHNKKYD